MEENVIGKFNAELIESVASLQRRVAALETERAELARKLEARDQSILYFKERYELMQRQFFGSFSRPALMI